MDYLLLLLYYLSIKFKSISYDYSYRINIISLYLSIRKIKTSQFTEFQEINLYF